MPGLSGGLNHWHEEGDPGGPLPLLHRHAVKRGPRTPAFRFLFGERGPDVDFCYAIPKRRSVRFKAEQVLLKAVPCAQSSAATRSTASNAAATRRSGTPPHLPTTMAMPPNYDRRAA